MKAFLYGLFLHFKLDFRNRDILVTYYVVPIVFFFFMGGIFSSINPAMKATLTGSMIVFAVTMGSALGTPLPLIEHYGSDIHKAFQVGGIPSWVEVVYNFLSGFAHLLIVSIIISVFAPISFGAGHPASRVTFAVGLVVFISTSVLLGCLFGLLVRSTAKLTLLSQAVFLPSVLLTGIMFPASMLPAVFERISMVLPATWGFKALTSPRFDASLLWPMLLMSAIFIIAIIWRLKRIQKQEN
jgi:ABC-2 type transport system permease protein